MTERPKHTDDADDALLDQIMSLRSANKRLIDQRLSLIKAVLQLAPGSDDKPLYVTTSGLMTGAIIEACRSGEEYIEITQYVRKDKL